MAEDATVNRHQRRAAEAIGLIPKRTGVQRTKAERTALYRDYIRHLPRVADDAPYPAGRLSYVLHDSWCRTWATGDPNDCNCEVELRRFEEPVRS
jgi:hypothetical protein